MNWWTDLTARWWADDQQVEPTEETRLWLLSKHEIALRTQPRTIGEFGVRAGYSAFAMLSAVPDALYLGIDIDSEISEAGALDHGRTVLATFPHTLVVVANTHDIWRVPPFDLLHIDGDHSFDGCTSDLDLARRSGVRWALVDDYDTGDIVRAAVDTFAAWYCLDIEHIADGFRGSALMDLSRAQVSNAA